MATTAIVLRRGTEYTAKDGTRFEFGVPAVVEEELANLLLSRGGKFAHATSEQVAAYQRGAVDAPQGFEHKTNAPKQPKNNLGGDNLNGKNVLLRRAGAIGDCVFVAQLAKVLTETYPDVSITMAVNAKWVSFVRELSHIASVVSVQDASKADFVSEFDYIVDFSGIIDGKFAPRRNFYELHFERAGLVYSGGAMPVMQLVANPVLHNEALSVLQVQGFSAGEYAVVLRATSNSMKTWTARIMARTVDTLSRATLDGGLPVLLLGTSTDHNRHIAPSNGNLKTLLDLPPPLVAHLIANAKVVVGGDTGFTHLAMALGVPTVSYWCATDSQYTVPNAPYVNRTKVIDAKTKCHPCNQMRAAQCPYYSGDRPECATQLDVAEIVDAAKTLCAAPEQAERVQTSQVRRLLSLDEARAVYNASKILIAVVVDDCNVWTGGGFYTWTVARSFGNRANTQIFVLSGTPEFVYQSEIPAADNVYVIYDPLRSLLFSERQRLPFRLVIGAPHKGGIDAARYGMLHKEECQTACLIYETPNYIAKYRDGRDTQPEFWADYVKAMQAADNVYTISQEVKTHLLEWLPELRETKDAQAKVEILAPCVINTIADTVLPDNSAGMVAREGRTNSIVMISRNVAYKSLARTIELLSTQFVPQRFSQTNQLTINVIGAGADRLRALFKEEWQRSGVTLRTFEACGEKTKWQLLHEAKAVIHPSNFEGFGIPVAEAMYACTPVIAQPLPVFQEEFAQHPYYVNSDTEMLETLHTIFDAWDEPVNDPGQSLKRLQSFLADAWAFVSRRYTEEKQAARINLLFAKKYKHAEAPANVARIASVIKSDVRLAMVTPWGNRCGIAETTRELLRTANCAYKIFAPYETHDNSLVYQDTPNVERCWRRDFQITTKLQQAIMHYAPNVAHFEHEFSLFRNPKSLILLLQALKQTGIKTVLTLHTVLPCDALLALNAVVDAIITTRHCPELPGSTVMPLPISPTPTMNVSQLRSELGIPEDAYVVGTFGMWQTHKGIAEFLSTYQDVTAQVLGRRVVYLVSSYVLGKDREYRAIYRRHLQDIDHNNIIVFTNYAPMEVVQQRMAVCNTMVYYYHPMQHASSSASVRNAFSAHKPVICSDVKMFEDLHDGLVVKVPFSKEDSSALAEKIVALATDKAQIAALTKAAKGFAAKNQAKVIMQAHEDLYRKLITQ